MPLTILVSFSLLALVVTARPILHEDSSEYHLQKPPTDIQNAVEAIFESQTGRRPDCLQCDDEDIRIHVTSVEQQNAVLSQLDLGAVQALVPLRQDGTRSPEEKELYNILSSLNDLDGGERPLEDELSVADSRSTISEQDERTVDPDDIEHGIVDSSSILTPRIAVLLLSCIASLLVLACIATALYITKVLRAQLLVSRGAWDLLPKLEKGSGGAGSFGDDKEVPEGKLVDFEDSGAEGGVGGRDVVVGRGLFAEVTRLRLGQLCVEDSQPESEKSSHVGTKTESIHSDAVEMDEQYHDVVEEHSHPDPDLIPLPNSSPSSPSRRPLEMHEIHLESNNHPAWAVQQGRPREPDAAPPARRRAYGAPLPELNFALAMQLRPGFGVGADAAWLVRFVMTFFGWCAVLVSGRRRE